MSKLEARERFVGQLIKEVSNPSKRTREKRKRTSPSDHYTIGESERLPVDITVWLGSHLGDRATKDFMDNLKDHLIQRIHGDEYHGEIIEFTDEERDNLIIVRNTMFEHKTMSVNYTTYDLRREQDTINPRTHADIMILSQETDSNRHPYWYARVLRIFHVNIRYYGENSPSHETQRKDVLFVRWFGRNLNHPAGFAGCRLPRLGFLHEDDEEAFSFLDPDLVIRGIHLIPTFSLGKTDRLLGHSLARCDTDGDEDWESYDVNIFVDRDLFMRYRGGGVGHTISRDWDAFLESDRQRVREKDIEAREQIDMGEEQGEESSEDEDEDEDEEDGDEGEGEGKDEDADGGDREAEGDVEEEDEEEESEEEDSESEEEEDGDRVIADEGEELDDDLYAQEGYGAL